MVHSEVLLQHQVGGRSFGGTVQKAMFPPEFWSVYWRFFFGLDGTTNENERLHHYLNANQVHNKPDFREWLESLRRVTTKNYMLLALVEKGEIRHHTPHFMKKQRVFSDLHDELNVTGDKLDFINKVARQRMSWRKSDPTWQKRKTAAEAEVMADLARVSELPPVSQPAPPLAEIAVLAPEPSSVEIAGLAPEPSSVQIAGLAPETLSFRELGLSLFPSFLPAAEPASSHVPSQRKRLRLCGAPDEQSTPVHASLQVAASAPVLVPRTRPKLKEPISDVEDEEAPQAPPQWCPGEHALERVSMEALFSLNPDVKLLQCNGCERVWRKRSASNMYYFKCDACSWAVCYRCLWLSTDDKRSTIFRTDFGGKANRWFSDGVFDEPL